MADEVGEMRLDPYLDCWSFSVCELHEHQGLLLSIIFSSGNNRIASITTVHLKFDCTHENPWIMSQVLTPLLRVYGEPQHHHRLCGTELRSNIISKLEIPGDLPVAPQVDPASVDCRNRRLRIASPPSPPAVRASAARIREELAKLQLKVARPDRRHDGMLRDILKHKARDYANKRSFNELIYFIASYATLIRSIASILRVIFAKITHQELKIVPTVLQATVI